MRANADVAQAVSKEVSKQMSRSGTLSQWLFGIGIGAGLMYWLDPDRGRRRRALTRDRAVHTANMLRHAAAVAARDTQHRVQGLWARARGRLAPANDADEVLLPRVRSAIGRAVSHTRSIEIDVHDGRVTLHGPVLAHEVDELLACVAGVRGVREVDNQLTVHQRAGDVPGLQGEGRRADPFELMQDNWPPAARVLTSVIGGTLIVNGLARRSPFGFVLAAVGAGLLARGLTNRPVGTLVGVHGQRRPIFVRKTILIDAAVEHVFGFWSRPENFPRFMKNVREVEPLGGNRSRWVVAGPAGAPIEWTAEVTEMVNNELLSWRSEPGSNVQQWGTVRFTPLAGEAGAQRTRLDIMLAYYPPVGDLGHAVAKLFASDPESEMETDLARMKTLLETGQPPRDAAKRKGDAVQIEQRREQERSPFPSSTSQTGGANPPGLKPV
jgi:uncharacterized membrane protein